MTTVLGTRLPLIQGAMAQISQPALVAAVSTAGGLGVLTTTGMTAADLAAAIAEIQAQTDQPFGVNLMLQQPNIEAMVTYLIAHPVPVVTTSAGTPKLFAAQLKDAGTKIVAVVPSVKVATKMAHLGVDALVAEGMESGGHIGALTTFALVQQVTRAVDLPVFAAGGIADAAGLVAAAALGAVGVQCGTAFLVADETPIADGYKDAIIAATDTGTVITGRALGSPTRCLQNAMTETYLKQERAGASTEALDNMLRGSLKRAIDGDVATGMMMAGQIAGKITRREPAAAIVNRICVA